jgi:hypothetical protein
MIIEKISSFKTIMLFLRKSKKNKELKNNFK